MSINEMAAAEGMKFDSEKPRMDLIDGYALEELAKVLTFGAKKYAPHNWRKGIAYSRLIAAILRHTTAILRGEWKDPETGLPHAAHIQCTAMFLTWMGANRKDLNDLWSGKPKDTREWLNRLRVPADAATLSTQLPHGGQEKAQPYEAYLPNMGSEQ